MMYIEQTVTIGPEWIVAVGVLNSAGCVLAVSFLVFNNYYRKNW